MSKKTKKDRGTKAAELAGSAVIGAGAGYATVAATGMTAAGMIGGGSGIGMAAGPVGIAAGALIGATIWGICQLFGDD